MLYIDGFDLGDVAKRYVAGGVTWSTATRFGVGKALNLSELTSGVARLVPASSRVWAGFAFWSNDAQTGPIISFFGDLGMVYHSALWVVSATVWGIYRGDGTLLATFAAPAQSAWNYVEVSATVADSGGIFIVKVNGVVVASFTGDTRNGGTSTNIDQFRLGYTGDVRWSGGRGRYDDFWITDTGFLGDKRVQTLTPNGAGSSTQWTPTAGTNYGCTADDDDATYVASSTAGQRDLYTLTNLVANTVVVDAVQTVAHAYKSDAGSAFSKSVIKSGSTIGSGASVALPSSVAGFVDTFATDPDTSAAWTVAAVNALEAGVEVV